MSRSKKASTTVPDRAGPIAVAIVKSAKGRIKLEELFEHAMHNSRIMRFLCSAHRSIGRARQDKRRKIIRTWVVSLIAESKLIIKA